MKEARIIEFRKEITPELLAKIFWEMDDEEQAQFFTALGGECGDYAKMDMQLCSLRRTLADSHPVGLEVFRHFGEWANYKL